MTPRLFFCVFFFSVGHPQSIMEFRDVSSSTIRIYIYKDIYIYNEYINKHIICIRCTSECFDYKHCNKKKELFPACDLTHHETQKTPSCRNVNRGLPGRYPKLGSGPVIRMRKKKRLFTQLSPRVFNDVGCFEQLNFEARWESRTGNTVESLCFLGHS